MRISDTDGSEFGAKDYGEHVDVDILFDVFAEFAREKNGFLLAVQQKLIERGYTFATMEWLQRVLRDNPELTMRTLCSNLSKTYSTNNGDAMQVSNIGEKCTSNKAASISTCSSLLPCIGSADDSDYTREDSCEQIEPVDASNISKKPESASISKDSILPEEAGITSSLSPNNHSADSNIELSCGNPEETTTVSDVTPNLLVTAHLGQQACVSNTSNLNLSSGEHSSKAESVAVPNLLVESNNPSILDSNIHPQIKESAKLAAAVGQDETSRDKNSVIKQHSSASSESIADSPDSYAVQYNDQPALVTSGKIPVTLVEFNDPNDIVVRRNDLGFTCEQMSKYVTGWHNKLNPGQRHKYKCTPEKAVVGCPVLFEGIDECKRAIITRASDNVCDVRLVDDGYSVSDVTFDSLNIIPRSFAACPPLTTRMTLNMSNDDKEWNKQQLASMKDLCFLHWNEADLVYSGVTDLNSRNFLCGNLFTKETLISLKDALKGYLIEGVVSPQDVSTDVQADESKIESSPSDEDQKQCSQNEALDTNPATTTTEKATVPKSGKPKSLELIASSYSSDIDYKKSVIDLRCVAAAADDSSNLNIVTNGQSACIGSEADFDGSSEDHCSDIKLLGKPSNHTFVSDVTSTSDPIVSGTVDDPAELADEDNKDEKPTSNNTVFAENTRASNDPTSDAPDTPTDKEQPFHLDETFKEPAAKYSDQPQITIGCKIPVTLVDFSDPNDILVRRNDLPFTFIEMSKYITIWYSENPDERIAYQCSFANAHVGCPVIFIALNGCKRAIITHVADIGCSIRLVDEGDAISDIPFDRLSLLPSMFAACPPLITIMTLNIPNKGNKGWDAQRLASMNKICSHHWKEADLEYSGGSDLKLRNFVSGDLFTKETHISMKEALNSYLGEIPLLEDSAGICANKSKTVRLLPEVDQKHRPPNEPQATTAANPGSEKSTVSGDIKPKSGFRFIGRQKATLPVKDQSGNV